MHAIGVPPVASVLAIGTGELAALVTAMLWAVGAMCFAAGGKRIGSKNVNRVRLLIATVMTGVAVLAGLCFPALGLHVGAPAMQVLLLALSGFIGLVIGDAAYFESLVVLGPRRATLLTTLSPVFTALLMVPLLGETVGWLGMLGMAVTLGGVAIVVSERAGNGNGATAADARDPHIMRGVVLGVIGSLGQAVGFIVATAGLGHAEDGSVMASLFGMDASQRVNDAGAALSGDDVNPIFGTFVRMSASFGIFLVWSLVRREVGQTIAAAKDRTAMKLVFWGALFGPVVGVSLSMLALATTNAAVASTIMATMPVVVIPMVVILHKERVSGRAVLGSVIAVAGVALLTLRETIRGLLS